MTTYYVYRLLGDHSIFTVTDHDVAWNERDISEGIQELLIGGGWPFSEKANAVEDEPFLIITKQSHPEYFL